MGIFRVDGNYEKIESWIQGDREDARENAGNEKKNVKISKHIHIFNDLQTSITNIFGRLWKCGFFKYFSESFWNLENSFFKELGTLSLFFLIFFEATS